MNWIKKLFSKKEDLETSINNPKEQIKTLDKAFKTYNKSIYKGIDNSFIDLIYFKNAAEKDKYIKEILSFIDSIGIDHSTDIVTAKKIISESDESENFDFLFDSLLFVDTKIQENENGEKIIINQREIEKGINKVTDYYSALGFGCFNIARKMENNELNWTTEINLINNALENSDLYNYARLDALTFLTISFYKINQPEYSELYFSKIKNNKFDLAPNTITEFYTIISDYFKSVSKTDKVIECLEAGLLVNPKYGVKRELEKLKKEKSS